MPPPKEQTVYMLGHPLTVRFVKRSESEFGSFSPAKALITVADGPESVVASTLLHELKEAAVDLMASKDELAELPSGKVVEFTIRACETGLFSVFRDPRNEWIIRMLSPWLQ